MTGSFIALEGLDGAGTTTQLALVTAWLKARGHEVYTTFEPSGGRVGRLIREVLRGEDTLDPGALALLFAADRLDHMAAEVTPAVARGNTVLTDRYVLSSLAYQGAQLELGWVQTINARARTPDLTIFVDVPVDVCLERMASRGERPELYEKRGILERVDGMYRQILGTWDHARMGALEVVDGRPDPTAVASAIKACVTEHGLA